MTINSYSECLVSAQGDGTAVTNTTPASLLPTAARVLIPGRQWSIGKRLRVHAMGRISNIVTTPGTLTLDLRMGPTLPAAIVVANGGAMALNIVAKTNVPWWLEWDLTLRAVGSGTSANFMHQGLWCSESVIGSPAPAAGGVGQHMLPNAAPAVGTGFDSTANNYLDLFATWSINNAGNTLQLHQLSVSLLN